MEIRTRFAPSPTGSMHIGNLRTALYAYALAKHSNGEFILRIEDTDKKREVGGITEEIKEQLNIFKLIWDEYYVQSERLDLYKNAAQKLVENNCAFYCQCPARNAKEEGYSEILRDPCRDKNLKSGAIKLKVPDGEKISFKDFVLDKIIEWSTDMVPETTLLKSEEERQLPTYHLAAVVDDHEMNISHVLRGHDWMPSTPVHLLVYKYLGFEPPQIGHLTDILDPDGGKLSKRKGSVSVKEMLGEGYLPEAILNFIMLLGWAPKDNREIFSLADFVAVFDEKGFQKSNPIFNREKLNWFNGEYLRQKTDDELKSLIADYNSHCSVIANFSSRQNDEILKKTTPLIKDRITKLSDFEPLAGFLFERPKVDVSLFGNLSYKEHINGAVSCLSTVTNWNNDTIQTSLTTLIEKEGWKTGDFFMSFRIALSGSKFTPPITNCAEILGKGETLARLSVVVD